MAVVDLHLHTTASDGRLTPTELVRLLAQRGIRIAAITDHDTTAGLEEALEEARHHPQLTLIPGVELSADVPDTEVHILGYFIDCRDPSFQRTLTGLRCGREERARRMVERLAELGMPLDWSRVQALAQGAIGRPHIAQAMIEQGYVSHLTEAFDRYIGRSGPAYVERPKLSPEEAVGLIRGAGGLAVFAHPALTREYRRFLPPLRRAGLVGMEVSYGTFAPVTVRELQEVAEAEGLLPCGGSDYHALGTPEAAEPGQVGPPLEVGERLLEMARALGRLVG